MDAISYSHSVKQEKRIKKFIENPDSNSGVLTQPKVIAAGETVTIKSGRQAILANTLIEGDLVIEAGGEVFIPAGAGFSDLDQKIDTKLDKDFSSFTNKPTPDDTDNLALQDTGGLLKKLSFANLKNWIKSFSFGWGQTLQNVTGSRSVGVTYTNNTGKPMTVIIQTTSVTTIKYIAVEIDGVRQHSVETVGSGGAWSMSLPFVVNPGSTYKLFTISSLAAWYEYR